MKSIVCFGEVLWDMLPTGKKLGGAPLNVALRAQSLGNQATVISAVGNDKIGEEILEEMKTYSASLKCIQRSKNFDTSVVLVHLDNNGSASYEIKKPCAWDDIELSEQAVHAVKTSDAFIYGSLSARSSTSRETLLILLKNATFKVFDVNLRPPHYSKEILEELMSHADFIKFNDSEIFEICKELGFESISLEKCIDFIAKQTNTGQICVTLGENGAILYYKNNLYKNTGYKVTVADTVGAGDSFLATIIHNILNGTNPQIAIDNACAVGAIVATHNGANPVVLAEAVELIKQQN